MRTQETQSITTMAKMAATRPSVAVTLLLAEKPTERNVILQKLRVYPAALIGLLRADNLPRAWKSTVESELASAGYKMMT